MVAWKKSTGFLRSVIPSHPLGPVLSVLLPILGVFLFIGSLAYLGSSAIEKEYNAATPNEYTIVDQQVQRIKSGARGDIVIFGDSSGLMGIDPGILEKELGRSVQNFCTLGYAGPESYGIMLKEYLARNRAPELVLFAFHPAQLGRSKKWEEWPKYIGQAFKAQKEPALSWHRRIKNFFDTVIYDRILYIPLKGSFGGYYGSQKSVEAAMESTNGSLIDPGVLFFRKFKAQPAPHEIKGRSDVYVHSLQCLKGVLDTSRLPNVALLRTPLPDHLRYDTTKIAWDYEEIGKALGIKNNRFLREELSALPGMYFSFPTHLNRHGKAYFSKLLAEKLKPLLSARKGTLTKMR